MMRSPLGQELLCVQVVLFTRGPRKNARACLQILGQAFREFRIQGSGFRVQAS